MENLFIEIVKQINPVQTVILGLIVFYFYNRQKDEIKNVESSLRSEIKNVESSLRSEIKNVESSLRSEIKDLRTEVNTKYDKLNDLVIDLYRTLFKKDVA